MNPIRGICASCVLAALPLDAGAQLPEQDCRLTAPWLPGIAAYCTMLELPENPASPDGTTIELFVARVPSINPAPREDPLLVIAGGPGQAATEFYPSVRAAFEPIRRDRDIVLVDQRGTGRSAALQCPQATAATLELADPQALGELMTACLGELGGDPRLYTTSVAVLDLERVREALDVPRWNLYGVSYGTRVAQHYLRRYPERVRAAILDGVVPSDAALGPDVALQAQRVLDAILERCAADQRCAASFPALGARLDALLRSVSDAPMIVSLVDPRSAEPLSRELSREHVTAVLRLLSYSPQSAALLPLLIDAASSGNAGPLAAQAQMLTRELESVLSVAMHNTVVCTEDVPFFPAVPPPALASTYLGTSLFDALRAVCAVWPAGLRDADLREPLETDRPVLLLSGELDPITPPAYAEQALPGLANARHLVGEGQGHGLASVGCVPRLMRDFLETLAPASIDAQCLSRERPSPFFLDFNGPAP